MGPGTAPAEADDPGPRPAPEAEVVAVAESSLYEVVTGSPDLAPEAAPDAAVTELAPETAPDAALDPAEAATTVEAGSLPDAAPPPPPLSAPWDAAATVPSLPFVAVDTTTGAPSQAIHRYDCAPTLGEEGPEHLYAIDLPAAGRLRVEVLDASGVDIDVHVLGEMDLDEAGMAHGCLGRADVALVLDEVGPGPLWVVADTYSKGGTSYPGSYTLAIELEVLDVWQETAVAPGLVWKQKVYDDLFGARQTVNVLAVDLAHPEVRVRPWSGEGTCTKTSKAGGEAGALAALNGGFFDTSTCDSLDLVKIDGELITTNHLNGNPQATLGILPDDLPLIAAVEAWVDWPEAFSGLGGYPNLATDGLLDVWPAGTSSFFTSRHPRTAVGITGEGTLLLVTVDGRTEAGKGMSIDELAQYMLWLGAVDALNLDGGGSTTLWVPGMSVNGVVNYPSDNQTWDHWGERSVSDGLLVLVED